MAMEFRIDAYINLGNNGGHASSLAFYVRAFCVYYNMTQAELIANVANQTGVSKDVCKNVFQAIFSKIGDVLLANPDEKIQIPYFGTFKSVNHAARKGRNPQTGEEIKINAYRSAACSFASCLKKM